MATYESYLNDNDFDEELGEASYLDLDLDEDFDDYEEAQRPIDRRALGRRSTDRRSTQRRSFVRQPMRGARNSRRPNPGVDRRLRPVKPVSSNSVKGAFQNVGQDVAVLDNRVKSVSNNQINQLLVGTLSSMVFPPNIFKTPLKEPLVDSNGIKINEVVTGIATNWIPIIINILFTLGGKNIKKFLPIVLGFFVLFPDKLKDLGLSGIPSSTQLTNKNGTLNSLDNNSIILLVGLGGLFYLISKDKI